MYDKNIKNSIRKIHIEFAQSPYMKKTEQKLNQYYFACGCREGALFIYVLIIPIILYFLIFDHIYLDWPIIILGVLSASLLGKITGLIFSRYKLHKIYNELEKELKSLSTISKD